MKKSRAIKPKRTYTKNHTKRHGKHHKRNDSYVKTYAPYLPIVVSIILSLFISLYKPSQPGDTLAYATNTNNSGLLNSTNSHRSAHGQSPLSLNAKLNNAATAKAKDMVTRNYWSHNTPDNKEPWIFIDAAGYQYSKAGENLAYGFATSSETVLGWMNSPSHKANMLDPAFTEVGFGFANSENFRGDGNQTIVVAMYAKPRTLAATATAPINPNQAPKTPAGNQNKASPKKTTIPKETANQKPKDKPENNNQAAPVNSQSDSQTPPPAAAATQKITKIDLLTRGYAPWAILATVLITSGAIISILLRHSMKARHLWHDMVHGTEKFVLHHPLFDSIMISIIILGLALSRTVGTIL